MDSGAVIACFLSTPHLTDAKEGEAGPPMDAWDIAVRPVPKAASRRGRTEPAPGRGQRVAAPKARRSGSDGAREPQEGLGRPQEAAGGPRKAPGGPRRGQEVLQAPGRTQEVP